MSVGLRLRSPDLEGFGPIPWETSRVLEAKRRNTVSNFIFENLCFKKKKQTEEDQAGRLCLRGWAQAPEREQDTPQGKTEGS